MNHLKTAFQKVDGGIPVIAKACGVSVRAVYKWTFNGRLPRTDYTGETNYAETISKLLGADFKPEELRYPMNKAA